VEEELTSDNDNTTLVLAITLPLGLLAFTFAACALSAQLKSKRQSNKVAQLSDELSQAQVRAEQDAQMLSQMPAGKVG
jgi:hypothetical protein